MKALNLRLGIVVAGFALAAAPAFAQKPESGSSGGPQAGAVDRSSGGGGPAGGAAVDRGSGGSAGSSAGSSGAVTSSSASSGMSSPSASTVSSPSAVGFGDRAVREMAPQHRADFSRTGSIAYDEGQKATPRSSGPSGGGNSGGGAVTRGGGSSGGGAATASGGGTRAGSGDNSAARPGRTRPTASGESNPGTNNSTSTREVPTWSRPRGDRPATGTAVDRTTPVPDRNGYHGRLGYYDPYLYYGSPYGYGYGLGYGLYSGLGWSPYYGDPFGEPYGSGYDSYGYGGGGSSMSYGRGEQGNLKLKVKPRGAKVYVDGYFVGLVDQFDGSFQKLALNTGRHKVEIKADGFETAEFDVLINAQQNVTFQGELKRIQ